jgi:hypothetical protein
VLPSPPAMPSMRAHTPVTPLPPLVAPPSAPAMWGIAGGGTPPLPMPAVRTGGVQAPLPRPPGHAHRAPYRAHNAVCHTHYRSVRNVLVALRHRLAPSQRRRRVGAGLVPALTVGQRRAAWQCCADAVPAVSQGGRPQEPPLRRRSVVGRRAQRVCASAVPAVS